MRKTILVAEKDSVVRNKLVQSFLGQGDLTAVNLVSDQERPSLAGPGNQLLAFSWNKRSAVSTKNFLLQVVQQMGMLDEAWLVFSPEYENSLIHEMSASELEGILDQRVKGSIFLIREFLTLQKNFPTLKVHFVFFHEKQGQHLPLAALQYQGLHAFVSAILDHAKKKTSPIWAFETEEDQLEAFVRFILSVPRDLNQKKPTHGQWQRHSLRLNPFSQFLSKRTTV